MAAPVAGEPNLPRQNSDLHFINNRHTCTYDSAQDNFTISHLAKSKASSPNPHRYRLTYLLGNRRKSSPVRYSVSTTVEEKHPPSKPNIVVHDPSSNCMTYSFPKENSATKCTQFPVDSSPAMIRAEEIQSNLGTEHPSCIRRIVNEHIGAGCCMGFPESFSMLFLPKTDSDIVIEDEDGLIHHLKYIAHKNGLIAGWKKFANDYNLLEGDVLVFHLVEPFKFKVYILRENDMNKVDGATGLFNLETHTKQIISEKDTPSDTTMKSKQQIVSEVLEGSRPSNPDLSSQEIVNFEDFHIMVKGQSIDLELPEDVRLGYFKLCIGRKEFLHDNLPEGLYHKLVAGMIGETVNIANEIKNCKLTVSKEEFDVWDNSLKSFEILGMKVGFLRERIGKLSRIVLESEGRFDLQRFNEAKSEKQRIEDEIKDVMEKLVGLTEKRGKLDAIVGGLKEKVGRDEAKFQEEVDAPW
ncbi:hypothetical protein L1887_31530 [Cichorium endivia]|nr:hypothetical protein L1887_31530 [Cichorium endivia]